MFSRTDKILIMGRSGCGKSFLGKQIQSVYPRTIIFDPLHEYPDKPTDLHNFHEFANWIKQAEEMKTFHVVVKFPIEMGEDRIHAEFNEMIRGLYYLGNVAVVIEEISEFCTPHEIPEFLRKSMRSGRHQEIAFIMNTQRPGELHKTILSQSTHVFVGNMIDENDIKACSFLGQHKKELSGLKDRHFFWYSPYRNPIVQKFSTEKSKKDRQLTI